MTTPRPQVTFTNSTLDPGDLAARLRGVPHERRGSSAPPTPRDAYQSNINDLGGDGTSDESGPSAPSSIRMPSRSRWRMFWSQEVAQDRVLEAQMMVMTVITGVLDAATYLKFRVFATKQTGNTLFLAIYALHPGKLGYRIELNVAVSIVVFILGGTVFGQIGNKIRQRRRGWLCAATGLQMLLLAAATCVRAFTRKDDIGGPALAVIALTALASAGQITLAVGVGLAELNTTMITGSLIQLTGDRKVLQARNVPRNRRLIFILSYFSGAFIGSAAMRVEVWAALLIASCLKLGTCLSFLFNNGMIRMRERDAEMVPKAAGQDGTSTPVPQVLWGD